jgi:hypothetical protein
MESRGPPSSGARMKEATSGGGWKRGNNSPFASQYGARQRRWLAGGAWNSARVVTAMTRCLKGSLNY